jgi:multiple sugar transport system ATP-binding protein
LFVAGFIGSPQMNLTEVSVERNPSGCELVFAENRIGLSPAQSQALLDGGYAGKSVVMGIRPEDLYEEDGRFDRAQSAVLEMKVEMTEMLGAETFLYLSCEGREFTARVHTRSTAKTGDRVRILFDAGRIRFFDADTEQAICAGEGA